MNIPPVTLGARDVVREAKGDLGSATRSTFKNKVVMAGFMPAIHFPEADGVLLRLWKMDRRDGVRRTPIEQMRATRASPVMTDFF